MSSQSSNEIQIGTSAARAWIDANFTPDMKSRNFASVEQRLNGCPEGLIDQVLEVSQGGTQGACSSSVTVTSPFRTLFVLFLIFLQNLTPSGTDPTDLLKLCVWSGVHTTRCCFARRSPVWCHISIPMASGTCSIVHGTVATWTDQSIMR